MKRTILAIMLAFSLPALAQDNQQTIDTAKVIMDRYADLMNTKAIRQDSILYMETYIYYRSTPHDTAIMKRWFLPPNRFRCELWHGDTLLQGVYSDGKTVFREYNYKILDGWTRVAESRYYTLVPGYEFRGPLHNWRAAGSEVKYRGLWNFKGSEVHRVLMETPLRYNRYLLFEKESGLLFLIQETNEHSEYSSHQSYDHADWHAYHEYQPIGTVLLPSVESYQMGGDIVFHFTNYKYIPVNMRIFTSN